MWQFALFIFFISFCIFAGTMAYEPRTLWSGVSFFFMLTGFSVSLLLVLYQCSEWLSEQKILLGILFFVLLLAVVCMAALPGMLIVVFFVEGIKVIRHEGMKPANWLSVIFSVLLYGYLAVWPAIGNLKTNTFGTSLYIIISFSALYLLLLLAIYSFSAVLNLAHLKKNRKADYIVVLGSGIMGKKVTPLLAARIEKGIELLRHNPNAVLIMSGGQGPGEEIPESDAMAAYAIDRGVNAERIIKERKSVSTEENLLFSRELMENKKPKIVIVTTAYHVFRALLIAKRQGIKCTGYGAKTKWYFTLNALMREFAGYLSMTWKKHVCVIGVVACVVIWMRHFYR